MRKDFMEKAVENEPRIFKTEIQKSCFGKPIPDVDSWFQYCFEEAEFSGRVETGDVFFVDFGNHYVGTLSFQMDYLDAYPDAPVKVRIELAENLYELQSDYDDFEKGDMCSTWMQQEILYLDEPGVISLPRRYAFRYIKFTILESPTPVIFCGIKITAETSADIRLCKPISCDDPRLLEIDRIGCRTLQNCMQRIFEDGPKRDRRLWLGDLRLQALTGYYTFQNLQLVKKCLYLFAGHSRPWHRIPRAIFENSKCTVSDDAWLADYALMFPVCLCDYYEHTADKSLVDELFEIADEQMCIACDAVEHGVVRNLESEREWWAFIDWCDGLKKITSMQGVLLYTLDKMIRLCRQTGRTQKEVEYSKHADVLRKGAREKLYDYKSGYFVNCYDEHQLSVHSQIWMVLGNVICNEEAQKLMRRILQEKNVKMAVTPYMHHYIVEALIHVGMEKEALDYLKDYWGKMVEYGADTFWEVFVPGDFSASPYKNPIINSCCHAWSCSASYFIRKYFSNQKNLLVIIL